MLGIPGNFYLNPILEQSDEEMRWMHLKLLIHSSFERDCDFPLCTLFSFIYRTCLVRI